MSISRTKVFTSRAAAAAAIAAILTFTTAGCGGTSSAATKNENGQTIIRYQGSPSSVYIPELAEHLGYFQNIKLEWIGNVNGGPESIQAVATNQTDFGGAFNGAIVKLRDSGAAITSVISYYGSDEQTFNGLFVLEDSPIKSARDLIGRAIGVNTLGAHSEFVIKEWLAREGLSSEEISQVELKVLPAGTAEQVLREGQADGVILGQIAYEKAEERGGIRRVFDEAEVFGPQSFGSLVFRDAFIKENPEAVEEFITGTARAVRWTQENDAAEVQRVFTEIIEGRGRNESTETIKYWKSAGISTPGGVIRDEEFSVWLDWLQRNEDLKNKNLSINEIFTNEFNPYANGTYEPEADSNGK